jgi:hypothetical protein
MLLFRCSAFQNKSSVRRTGLEAVALDKFGAASRVSYNSDKHFALVCAQEARTAQNPNPSLRFFIFDVINEKIIFEDNLNAALARWKTGFQIEVIFTPGMVSKEDAGRPKGYIYDVKTGIKTDLASTLKSTRD